MLGSLSRIKVAWPSMNLLVLFSSFFFTNCERTLTWSSTMAVTRFTRRQTQRRLRPLPHRRAHNVSQSLQVNKSDPTTSLTSKRQKNATRCGRSRQSAARGQDPRDSTMRWIATSTILLEQGNVGSGIQRPGLCQLQTSCCICSHLEGNDSRHGSESPGLHSNGRNQDFSVVSAQTPDQPVVPAEADIPVIEDRQEHSTIGEDKSSPAVVKDGSLANVQDRSPSHHQNRVVTSANDGIIAGFPNDGSSIRPQTPMTPDEGRFPADPANVGLPSDGRWEHNAVFDLRFCRRHHSKEYLLGTPDRWMSPDDFDVPDAEDALNTRLQHHRSSPAKFDPASERCQGQCRGSLYTHVLGVLDAIQTGDRTYHLIQWKACWTPRDYIDDEDWIASSLKEHQAQGHRRSERLEESFPQRMAREASMWWWKDLGR